MKMRINAIYPEVPAVFECTDGTYSTSTGKRACSRHGGLKTGVPVVLSASGPGSMLLNIQDVPLQQVNINTKLFQGREKEYSERSVANIITDVQNGGFVWENLDPITLWQDDTKTLFLLSGHSRYEAFKRLAASGAVAQGKTFQRIPAKIVRNVPVEVAQRVALESNTLSTKENDVERATYYRKRRQEGVDAKDVLQQARKNEGNNAATIWAYTYLNPDGRAWLLLRQFADNEGDSGKTAKILAKWIGTARREYPQLTNAHENELYSWLFENKGYGTGAGQVNTQNDFLEKVGVFIAKNTFFGNFDRDKPLNITALLTKSPTEAEYDRQLAELNKEIQDTDKQLKTKIKDLSGKATPSDVQRIVAPIEAKLRTLRLEYGRLAQKKAEVIEYSKNEPTLFGVKGIGMKPVSLEIVVVTDNPQAVGQLSGGGADMRTFPANFGMFSTKEIQRFQLASAAAAKFIGMPVSLYWADKHKGNNISWINQNDISNFPAIKVSAVYPDGTNKGFWLNTDVLDIKTYTADDIVGMLRSLQKDKEAAESSFLCQLFPPLCSVGAYVWLGVVGIAAYKAVTADNRNKKYIFGAAALLAGNEFLSRGGLKTMGLGSLDYGPKMKSAKTRPKFGEMVDSMKNVSDAEAMLLNRDNSVAIHVKKNGALYTVINYTSDGPKMYKYPAVKFEENYRWYI